MIGFEIRWKHNKTLTFYSCMHTMRIVSVEDPSCRRAGRNWCAKTLRLRGQVLIIKLFGHELNLRILGAKGNMEVPFKPASWQNEIWKQSHSFSCQTSAPPQWATIFGACSEWFPRPKPTLQLDLGFSSTPCLSLCVPKAPCAPKPVFDPNQGRPRFFGINQPIMSGHDQQINRSHPID